MIRAILEKFEKLKDKTTSVMLRCAPSVNLHSIVDLIDKEVQVDLAGETIPDKAILLAEILASMRNIEEKLQNEYRT